MYPEEIEIDARNFIEQLVQKDPNLRPKCKNLLKHEFFTNNLKN
jgi:serine/threonine protein kinase